MSVELFVTLDRRNLARLRTLASASKRMAAQSLTFTAERAQTDWRAANPAEFHMRRKWINTGIRIRHATPGNLNAQVGTIDKYMGRHVKGIDETKRAGKTKLFVPIQPIESQGTHTQIRSALKRMDRTKTKPFMRHGVLLRRASTKRDAPLKVLAVLRKSVDIKPRLDALEIVGRAVHREFPGIYERLLLKWSAAN